MHSGPLLRPADSGPGCPPQTRSGQTDRLQFAGVVTIPRQFSWPGRLFLRGMMDAHLRAIGRPGRTVHWDGALCDGAVFLSDAAGGGAVRGRRPPPLGAKCKSNAPRSLGTVGAAWPAAAVLHVWAESYSGPACALDVRPHTGRWLRVRCRPDCTRGRSCRANTCGALFKI